MQGISELAENRLASQKGLCSKEGLHKYIKMHTNILKVLQFNYFMYHQLQLLCGTVMCLKRHR